MVVPICDLPCVQRLVQRVCVSRESCRRNQARWRHFAHHGAVPGQDGESGRHPRACCHHAVVFSRHCDARSVGVPDEVALAPSATSAPRTLSRDRIRWRVSSRPAFTCVHAPSVVVVSVVRGVGFVRDRVQACVSSRYASRQSFLLVETHAARHLLPRHRFDRARPRRSSPFLRHVRAPRRVLSHACFRRTGVPRRRPCHGSLPNTFASSLPSKRTRSTCVRRIVRANAMETIDAIVLRFTSPSKRQQGSQYPSRIGGAPSRSAPGTGGMTRGLPFVRLQVRGDIDPPFGAGGPEVVRQARMGLTHVTPWCLHEGDIEGGSSSTPSLLGQSQSRVDEPHSSYHPTFGCGLWVSPDRTSPTHEHASILPSPPPWAHSCAADDGVANLPIAPDASRFLACSSHVGWKLVGWIPWQGPKRTLVHDEGVYSPQPGSPTGTTPVGSRRPLPFSAPVSPWVVKFTTEGREGNEPSHDDRRFATREALGDGR